MSRTVRQLAPRLQLQALEDRAVPAVSADFHAGTLVVRGSNANDEIRVELINGQVNVDGLAMTMEVKQIRRVEVHGGGGDDYIEFSGANGVKKKGVAILLNGGDGDDTIVGGIGNETLTGGNGDDILDAGEGNDQLLGGDGDDQLWAGDGSDRLTGGAGDDAMYGEYGSDYLVGNSGADSFNGGSGRDSFKDDFDPTRLAVDGYAASDVQQGSGGTCAPLATLAASAEAGDNIAERITYLGDNTYRVKLHSSWMFGMFHRTHYEDVHFDGTWYDHDAQPTRQRDENGSPVGPMAGDFWTTIFQRAFMQQEGNDWRDPKVLEEFATSEANAHSTILGARDSRSIDEDDEELPSVMRATLQAGEAVTAGTRSFGEDEDGEEILEKDGIVSLHAYAVLDVYQQDDEWRVKLYNPWGWDAPIKPMDGRDDGIVDVSWAVFAERFEVWCRTQAVTA